MKGVMKRGGSWCMIKGNKFREIAFVMIYL
jgi:hypothetical protein